MNLFKSIFLVSCLYSVQAGAQTVDSSKSETKATLPKNWHLLDYSPDGYQGINLAKAYNHLSNHRRKSKKVIVAVIDSGIDTLHEDLKPVLWKNPKEVPGNGKDDDKNGYVDDIHGWNFIGGKDGRNVKEDSYEAARVFHKLKGKWENFQGTETELSPTDKKEYKSFLKAKEAIQGEESGEQLAFMLNLQPKLTRGDSAIRAELGKQKYTAADLKEFKPSTPEGKNMRMFLLRVSGSNDNADITNEQMLEEIGNAIRKADAANNPPKEYRKEIVGDNEADINDKFYGNNDLMAETPFHGTHCAGIIGAVRNNGLGMDGVADNVEIMVLRAVPDGDEHDKDIALAIRYAVDHGAKVISMSFGKGFSPEKKWVDDAFKYAEKKDVLLVHAAGNDSKNIDSADNFPNPVYEDGTGRAENVITVGASGDKLNGGVTASFSNYGKREVDVFAPGVGIYSTIPGGNTYGNSSGTSMACPVVAGLAALIFEYYPNLTAKEIKELIEVTARKIPDSVRLPGTAEKTLMSELCKNGGIIDAYEAITMADRLSVMKASDRNSPSGSAPKGAETTPVKKTVPAKPSAPAKKAVPTKKTGR
jgi:subtilisin family serine protease